MFTPRSMHVVLHSRLPVESVAQAARVAVWAIDSAIPLAQLQTINAVLSTATTRPRFLALLLSIFAGLALALAAIGTYAVMSHSVAERTSEIGLRMALGAESGHVLGLVVRQGLIVTLVGLAAGLVGALWLTRAMSSVLYGIDQLDPLTFIVVPLIMGLVATVACVIPARRAVRVDPVVALKYE